MDKFEYAVLFGFLIFIATIVFQLKKSQSQNHQIHLRLGVRLMGDEEDFRWVERTVNFWMVPRLGDQIRLENELHGRKVSAVRLDQEGGTLIWLEEEKRGGKGYQELLKELEVQGWDIDPFLG